MIGKLKGAVEELRLDHILLDVAGVCYVVHVARRLIESMNVGQKIELYIEQQITETSSKLYGFLLKKEQDILKILIKVKGISHKIALCLIDCLELNNLILAVQQKEAAKLKIKGVGAKLAERIISEAREDFLKIELESESLNTRKPAFKEAVSALFNLGFEKRICEEVVGQIIESDEGLLADEIIVLALKKL